MPERVEIAQSKKPDKRLKAQFSTRAVHFGAKGGSTFLEHGNAATKRNWEKRHRVREDWSDYDTAGALSKHVLWNRKTLAASLQNLNARQSKYKFVLKR